MKKQNRNRFRLKLFLVLAVVLLLAALFSRQLCPYDPDLQNLTEAMKPPGLSHPFGTDRYGRDLLSRVLVGGRTSIFSALFLVLVTAMTGTVVGMTAGWAGGILDTLLMRLTDLFLAFPGLVFALAVAGVLGGGLGNAVLALAVVGWPKFARLSRSLTLAEKEKTYLCAARLSGNGPLKLLFFHVLPNIFGQILVTAVLDIGTMIMELAGLSFLGLGVKPPMAEWGSMINDGRSMLQVAPWMVLAPGIAVFVTVMIFNLLGDAVRDELSPGQRQKERINE